MKLQIAMLFPIFVIGSCAHRPYYPDVRPGEKGVHQVLLSGTSAGSLVRPALSQARSYCFDVYKKSIAVVSEESKYVGNMDEQTYINSKRMAAAAQVVGLAGLAFGGENERTAGGIVSLGGVVGDVALGVGYVYKLKFKCS